jgi:hypothetical protein
MISLRRFLPALLLSLFVCPALALTIAYAQQEEQPRTFAAQGTGGINAGNLAQARLEAIQDALRKAVAQAVSGMLAGREGKKVEEPAIQSLYAEAERYVQTYRITDEYRGQTEYRVLIRATVATDSLRQDLGSLGILPKQGGGTAPATVTVAVQGIETYSDYKKFMDLLKNRTHGVQSIKPRLIQRGRTEFSVLLRGTAQSLTNDLKETGVFTPERIDERQLYIEGMMSGERIR